VDQSIVSRAHHEVGPLYFASNVPTVPICGRPAKEQAFLIVARKRNAPTPHFPNRPITPGRHAWRPILCSSRGSNQCPPWLPSKWGVCAAPVAWRLIELGLLLPTDHHHHHHHGCGGQVLEVKELKNGVRVSKTRFEFDPASSIDEKVGILTRLERLGGDGAQSIASTSRKNGGYIHAHHLWYPTLARITAATDQSESRDRQQCVPPFSFWGAKRFFRASNALGVGQTRKSVSENLRFFFGDLAICHGVASCGRTSVPLTLCCAKEQDAKLSWTNIAARAFSLSTMMTTTTRLFMRIRRH
jgi:hypothetical protein